MCRPPRSSLRASGRRACIAAAPTGSRGTPTSPTSPGTFAFGIGDRAEVFGSFLVDTRIDRDIRPIFVNDPAFGGFIDRYPRVNQYWTGDNVGDFYVGAKINLWSEYRQNPAAIAVRGMVKVPTGKFDAGVSTGKAGLLG